MDHFGPPSDKIFTIPLIRLLAANASASGDRHIFFNPGGPGGKLSPFISLHSWPKLILSQEVALVFFVAGLLSSTRSLARTFIS